MSCWQGCGGEKMHVIILLPWQALVVLSQLWISSENESTNYLSLLNL